MDPHTRKNWKHTMARRSIAKMGAVKCKECGDIGYIIDKTKRPMTVPCPRCMAEKQSFIGQVFVGTD
jgi:hypothetical protein